MVQLSFFSAICAGFLVLNPILAPAQDVQYASVAVAGNLKSKTSSKNETMSAKTFKVFEIQNQALATTVKKQYPALQDFSFEQRATLTHTFFTEKGQRMHVVFNKRNHPVLEVVTLVSEAYPPLVVSTLQKHFPKAEVVTVKHIRSEYGAWYEVVVRENDKLEKVEIAL